MDEKKNEPSLTEKIKGGVSMQELESLAKKHMAEVFLILAVLVATISSVFDFFTGPRLGIFFCGLGSIVVLALPKAMIPLQMKFFKFVAKQEKTGQIAIGVARLFIALFLPFILFAEIGMVMGVAFHLIIKKEMKEPPPENK